jgi:hypothetical protein
MGLGFLYITTSVHDSLLRPREAKPKKQYTGSPDRAGTSHAISDKLEKVNMRPQNMEIDDLFSDDMGPDVPADNNTRPRNMEIDDLFSEEEIPKDGGDRINQNSQND